MDEDFLLNPDDTDEQIDRVIDWLTAKENDIEEERERGMDRWGY